VDSTLSTTAVDVAVEPPPTRVGWEASSLDPGRPIAQARHRATAWVREQWQLGEVADVVELVVGELCANAVRHGEGLAALELVLRPGAPYVPQLSVLVADYKPHMPPRVVDSDDGESREHGRGLLMIEALATGWGWHPIGSRLKQVWCNLTMPTGALKALGFHPSPGAVVGMRCR
jgi:hypothetical protein